MNLASAAEIVRRPRQANTALSATGTWRLIDSRKRTEPMLRFDPETLIDVGAVPKWIEKPIPSAEDLWPR
jgi:hypothetical protein